MADHPAVALAYCTDVLSGEIPACQWVQRACRRHVDDLGRQEDPAFPYRFDPGRANVVCEFLELLPHTKGEWLTRHELLRLEPWQVFITCTVFGWVRKADGLRRYREVYIEVPRKNGKSQWSAAVGLYMLACDREGAAEVYSGATNEKQAWEVFRPALFMARHTEGLRRRFGVKHSATSVYIEATGARFVPIVGNPGDGPSPHLAIVDEFHEHPSPAQYDSHKTGMGARSQPLMWVITTAGVDLAGPCYDKRNQVQKVLEGTIENDELFGIVYTLDPEDDWKEFSNWKKANPNYGVSVREDYLLGQYRDALQRSSVQNTIRTKHLNQWMNARVGWMNLAAWAECEDPGTRLNDYRGARAWVAVDLASKVDVAALVVLLEDGELYRVFGRFYLPEAAADGEDRAHYRGWAADGWLTLTPGNVIDYQFIEDDLAALKSQVEILSVPFDPFQATQFSVRMLDAGYPMIEVGATVKNFSEPMKEVEKLVLEGKLRHDGNPVLTWMISNVVNRPDQKDNVYPTKERPENKIDGAVALIMAMNRALFDHQEVSVYETRGIHVF